MARISEARLLDYGGRSDGSRTFTAGDHVRNDELERIAHLDARAGTGAEIGGGDTDLRLIRVEEWRNGIRGDGHDVARAGCAGAGVDDCLSRSDGRGVADGDVGGKNKAVLDDSEEQQ